MIDLWYGTSGPKDAEIVLVGEAWGHDEAAAKLPFVGESGKFLDRILAEAGLLRKNILLTNVAALRPLNNEMWRLFHPTVEAKANGHKDIRSLYPTDDLLSEVRRLHLQINHVPRKLVIAAGNYALWALSNCTGYDNSADSMGRRTPNGIMLWRGSMWHVEPHAAICEQQQTPIRLLPIIHPAAILRQYSNRAVTVHDLKARVLLALKEDWRPFPRPIMWAPPTFEQLTSRMKMWLSRASSGTKVRLAEDIETMRNMITVIGFADSTMFAMAIPFIHEAPDRMWTSYWTKEQEVTIIGLINRLHSHPNIEIEGQNFLFDMQYERAYFGVAPKPTFDTMLGHHLLFPGTPKGLAYLSSLYCRYHWYWKGATGDDSKEGQGRFDPDEWLEYNCLDTLRTWECGETLRHLIVQLKMEEQWKEKIEENDLAFRMMNKGVKIDLERRNRLNIECMNKTNELQARLASIIPLPIVDECIYHITGKLPTKTPWYNSPMKQKIFFEQVLGMKLPRHRKTKQITMGKEALSELPKKYPIWTRVFDLIGAMRSIGVFQSHFIRAPLDPDLRMRCMFKPAGTETHRWSSSTNAFGRGTNLQNIPSGDEE